MKIRSSFNNALQGIVHCYKRELNFRIHLVIMSVVILQGLYFSINKVEWLLVIVCFMSVLMLEMMNTALERICDQITNDFHPKIKIIKDISAGAVLVSAVGSCIIGGIIFIPKIL